MEDIIDIIVTETTNLIEITSQPTDEIIDVNIIDNRENITLNVTPTVVEININSLTGNFGVNWGEIGGTLSSQTDLNTALGLKADLVDGKVPSSQLPSYVDDVVEVANYAALPVTGEIGKIYITLDTNYIYRWSGSIYIQILDSAAVWGAITGSLSSQSDLVTALSGKFNNPTGDTTQYIAGDGSLITFPVAGQAGSLVREVRNTTGATLTKGTIVYISGATGNKPTVSKALATGDSTSAQTFGMLQADLANNANGYVVCVGNITGLDTSALTEGVQLYLSSSTAGTYTTTKQVAPAHLVYIGVVTRSHPTLGQIEVKIQNGYELDEIHDVLITSKSNNDGLFYESSTSLWKNKSIANVLGYSPEQPLTFASPLIRSTNAISIQVANGSQNGYLSSADWTTFNAKQAALSGTGFVKISGSTISYDNKNYPQTSGLTDSYLPYWNSTLLGGSLTDSFISILSNVTYVSGLGLSTLNGIDIQGNYGGGAGGVKIRSYDATTGISYIDFANTGGRMYLGLNKSTSGGLMTNASAYATVLTTGLGTANLEFGTNATKRVTIDGTTGAVTLTSTISATGASFSGALSGTSATFSGNTETLNLFIGTSTTIGFSGAKLFMKSANALDYNGAVFQSSTNSNSVTIAHTGTIGRIASTYGTGGTGTFTDLAFATSGVDRFTIASTGAATFSSSVTAGSLNLGSSYGLPKLYLYNDGTYVNGFGIYANEFRNFFDTIDASTSRMTWGKQTAGGTFTEFMRLTKDGNVGIGTSSPANYTNYITQTINGANGAIVQLQSSGTQSLRLIGEGVDSYLDNVSTGALIFRTTSSSSERMRITSSGNVGFGTTAPSVALEVSRATSTASYIVGTNGSGVQTAIGVAGDNGSLLGTLSNHNLRIVTNGSIVATFKTSGVLNLANVPTSSAGLSSGDIYKSAGVLMIV